MITPTIPENEDKRLEELYRYEIMDTSFEEEFDDIVRLASQICQVPISLISLVEKSRQWFKAKVGLDARETSRDVSFCAHSLDNCTNFLEVEDATLDERFFDNPLVTQEPHIRFYAGIPLVSSNGYKLGTLCVINSVPQHLNESQLFALRVLADQVMKMLELRIRNKQMDRVNKRLHQQSELQNKIISIIAHDVRNPIASLKNIIDLTNNHILTAEEGKELTGMAEKQLDSTLILLSDLVEWGKMQLCAHVKHPEPIHLHSFVTKKLDRFEVEASLKKNKLVNLVDEDLVLSFEDNALRFVLRNIISNAIKFTSNGTITVYAHNQGHKTLVAISDTGVGMDEKIKARLFNAGGRYSSLGTNNEQGTGLGLMLTRDFIELSGGTLSVESELGKGTTISIEFNTKL